MHRPKPRQNLVIRAGFVFLFFLHRVGNGLSIFSPRPGPGSSGSKKNRNPGTDPIITWLLTDYYPIVTHFHQIFIFVENFFFSCTSHVLYFEFLWYPKTTGVSSIVAPPLSQTNYTRIPSKIHHFNRQNYLAVVAEFVAKIDIKWIKYWNTPKRKWTKIN